MEASRDVDGSPARGRRHLAARTPAVAAFVTVLLAPAGIAAADGPPTGPDASRPGARTLDWPSLSGSGLISLPDTSTLPRGRVNLAAGIDNRDRDPLKMDVLDFDAVWTIGVARGWETYGRAALSRAITVSPRQALFPAPIDLVLPEGAPVPERPYYPIYSAFPYISRKGRSQLGRFNLGEAVLGVKRTLWPARGLRPAMAVSGEVKLPLTRTLRDLQSGSGTGGIDEGIRLTSEWGGHRRSLVGSVSYTHAGNGALGDRRIVYGPSGEVTITDQPLVLPGSLAFGAGLRQVLTPWAALVAETVKVMEVGGRTRAFRLPGPVDVTTGAQLRLGRLRGTLALRYHANSVSHRQYAWPLGGLADFIDVSDQDRSVFLQAIGAASVVPYLRRGSQTAIAIPAGAPPLPTGARVLPPTFTMGPHGEFSYVFLFTWAVGTTR
jgi:hypothetical protein